MAGRGTRTKAREMEDLGFQCSLSELLEESPKTVVQLSKFFGEPGEDVKKWLRSFEQLRVREMFYLLFYENELLNFMMNERQRS